MLLVISNFSYLADVLIPSMLSQLEAAFGTSMLEDRQVSGLTEGRDRSSPAVCQNQMMQERLITRRCRH